MDRFARGFLIGMSVNVVKDSLNAFSYFVLHYSKSRYYQLISAFLLRREAKTTIELIYALLIEMAFAGVIGVFFMYYAYRIENKRNLWFKGLIFVNGVNFLAFTLGTFFKIPTLNSPPIETAVSSLITTSIFGVLLGYAIYWWESRHGGFQSRPKQSWKPATGSSEQLKAEADTETEKIKLIKPIKLK